MNFILGMLFIVLMFFTQPIWGIIAAVYAYRTTPTNKLTAALTALFMCGIPFTGTLITCLCLNDMYRDKTFINNKYFG